ncbi:MAG: ATP-binding protein [Microscillaceae bacterium]|nr:ATP-binding protein [Microscillaceae bacterium]
MNLPKLFYLDNSQAQKIQIAKLFNWISFVSSLFFSVLGWFIQAYFLFYLNISLTAMFAANFYFCRVKFYDVFILSFLVEVNFATFLLELYLGYGSGGFLYFFPIILVNYYFFGFEQFNKLLFSVGWSVLFLILLQINRWGGFLPPMPLSSEVQTIIFSANLSFSAIFLLFWLTYIFYQIHFVHQNLLAEKNKFQGVLDNSWQSMVIIDRNFKVVICNEKAVQQSLTYQKTPIKVGLPALDFVAPPHRPNFTHRVNQAFAGESFEGEILFELAGIKAWYEVSYIPMHELDGSIETVLFSNIEITSRKLAEEESKNLLKETQRLNEELQANEEELIQTLDHTLALNQKLSLNQQKLIEAQAIAKIGSWELNLDTQEIIYSEQFFQIYDLEIPAGANVPYQYFFDLIHPEDAEVINKVVGRAVVKQENFQVNHRIITARGLVKYVESIGLFEQNPINNQRYFRGTTQDVTADKLVEEKLQQKNEELEKLNQELDSFVYSVSHDLRAPMASVLGLINLTKEEVDTPSVLLYLELMQKSIQKLDVFIRSVTDYSRNNRLEIIPEPIDFEAIIDDIVEGCRYMSGAERIQTEIDIQQQTTFYSDPNRLRIVLNNIISNAFKYFNPQQSQPYISIQIRANAHNARMTIIDNGIGIDKQYVERVFEMFYRASQQSTGSGLGLYIVKQTIEKLQGKLHLNSELGEGTEFFIEIPNLV